MTFIATAAVLALSLSAGAKPSNPDELARKDLGRIVIEVPKRWKTSTQEGTRIWAAPKERAAFLLDIFPNSDGRPPEDCRADLMAYFGTEKPWVKQEAGGAPAAHLVEPHVFEGRQPEGEMHTWVGCNERAYFVLRFVFATDKKDRFASLGAAVVRSLTYK